LTIGLQSGEAPAWHWTGQNGPKWFGGLFFLSQQLVALLLSIVARDQFLRCKSRQKQSNYRSIAVIFWLGYGLLIIHLSRTVVQY
jgi:hypothetical protein